MREKVSVNNAMEKVDFTIKTVRFMKVNGKMTKDMVMVFC